MEDQTATGCRGVDILGDGSEADKTRREHLTLLFDRMKIRPFAPSDVRALTGWLAPAAQTLRQADALADMGALAILILTLISPLPLLPPDTVRESHRLSRGCRRRRSMISLIS
ncbi:DUF4158 domain-containing protein [Sinorhizobium fredii]|uniref:DUF4158 domain-containing protein n=2 Tax=Rhizobium fredii TaxID=380 RepID=UPI001FCC8ACA|nr:DUF4158 domain-containing protein [Sinorhizobium fredii]